MVVGPEIPGVNCDYYDESVWDSDPDDWRPPDYGYMPDGWDDDEPRCTAPTTGSRGEASMKQPSSMALISQVAPRPAESVPPKDGSSNRLRSKRCFWEPASITSHQSTLRENVSADARQHASPASRLLSR